LIVLEYHGWAVVRDEGGDMVARAEVEPLVRVIDIGANIVCMKVINAQLHVLVSGSSNHRGAEFNDVVECFRRIGVTATGSYGLLHVWDDEDDAHENEFRIYVLRRGQVVVESDSSLSPCVPQIDDADGV
jgi:hypothetical protein